MESYNKYKIAFTSACSIEGLYSQIKIEDFKKVPALEVFDVNSHPGLADFVSGPKALIKMLMENAPDALVTYNDTVRFYTNLSILLGIPKIRVQDDEPVNIKWRASYLYDTESPLTFISAPAFLHQSKYNKRFQELLNGFEIGACVGADIWQCSSFIIPNISGEKDLCNTGKDIDIVFVGDVSEITGENISEYIGSLPVNLTQGAVEEIHQAILNLSGAWEHDESDILEEIFMKHDITVDERHVIKKAALNIALPSVRRSKVLNGLIERFGHKYNIRVYGGYQLAKNTSELHYGGMVFGNRKADVFRRSRIQVHVHNSLQYNASRMLESYRYSCLCLSNCCADKSLFPASAIIAGESVPAVPKFRNIEELYALCEYYLQNEKGRTDVVDKVLSLIPKEIDVSEKINAYIRFFDYVKNMNIKVNPFDFSLLQYDHEVIELCGLIEECCLELGLNEKASYYKQLREHFISMLERGYREKPERALAFAYYNFQNNNDSVKALQIVDTYCADLESARVFKGKMHILLGNFQEAIKLLSSFSCGDAGDEAYRLSYLSSAYQSIGDYASALDSMLRTLDLTYPLPHLHYYIAFLYYLLNDFGKAKEYFLVNTGIEKSFLPAFVILGDICFEKFRELEVAYDAYYTAVGIASRSQEKDRIARCIYFLDRMAICKLYAGKMGEAGGHWKKIIEDFDDQNIDAHCKLFLLLLATNTRDALWETEVSFIIGKGVNLKVMYQKVRDDFPADIAANLDKAIGPLK